MEQGEHSQLKQAVDGRGYMMELESTQGFRVTARVTPTKYQCRGEPPCSPSL